MGERFFLIIGVNKLILDLVERKWNLKSTLFAKLTPMFLKFRVSKKSYSGRFGRCSGVDQDQLLWVPEKPYSTSARRPVRVLFLIDN